MTAFFSNQPQWTILSDFDGTISEQDTTDVLLNRFAPPIWQLLEQQWKAGLIGSRTCMAEQIALLNMSQLELDQCIDTLTIDPHFADFVALMDSLSIPVSVVSDGLDYVIATLLARHQLAELPIFANRLLPVNERQWRLEFPHAIPDCVKASGNCKCNQVHQLPKAKTVIYIGDGSSDYCVSHQVDLVLAKDSLIDYCHKKRLPFIPIHDFQDVMALWPQIQTGDWVSHAATA